MLGISEGTFCPLSRLWCKSVNRHPKMTPLRDGTTVGEEPQLDQLAGTIHPFLSMQIIPRCTRRRSFYNQRGANLDADFPLGGSILHDLSHHFARAVVETRAKCRSQTDFSPRSARTGETRTELASTLSWSMSAFSFAFGVRALRLAVVVRNRWLSGT